MCGKPSMPAASTAATQQQEVVEQKQADASVTKANAAQQQSVLKKQTNFTCRKRCQNSSSWISRWCC